MRHSRSAEFEAALRESTSIAAGWNRWTHVADDPNDVRAVVGRAEVLRHAWRPPVTDRVSFLEDRCRGRRVLDIGCVAHDVARMRSPSWLHGRLAAVSDSCLGVDVLDDGVQAMRAEGYDAVVHDLTLGLGPVAESGPFDVIVAGEIIEHVESLSMLFATAAQCLAPGGELIMTTPNPYAPHRVRAAQLGIVWENVDHILYAFPSGVAELAERHGLTLSEAMTTSQPRARPLDQVRAARRRLQGRQWTTMGFSTLGARRARRVSSGPLTSLVRDLRRPARRFTGETFIYVVRADVTSAGRSL